MPRVWLPIGANPAPFPRDEREQLLNRLYQLRYALPGGRQMEIQQLRDYVAYCEKRAQETEEVAVKAGREKVAKMSPEQVRGAIKEYVTWRRKRQVAAGLRPKSHLG